MLVAGMDRGSSYQAIDDRDAIRRIASGDPVGLEALYDRHATLVYSLALRVLRDTGEAEDVTQDVFARVWASAVRFDPARGAVAAWLTVMARSRALDRLRRRRHPAAPVASEDAGLTDIPDPAPSVELMAATAEQVTAARDALAELPADQRTTLELAYYEGLTQVEIAERTATPLGTVKTRIRVGLQRLRDAVAIRSASTRSQS
jgi:RNA polymerase sigma-70 factor (ECF subfamily)